MIILRINQLPEDLVGEISSFISLESLSLCNKFYWSENYKKKLESSNSKLISTSAYWRFLLRYDYSFIFKAYLDYYFPYFIKHKRIIYQDKIFPRKVELIKYLSTFVFDSQKCKIVLEHFMRKDGLVFKRIKTRFNKWTN